MRTSLSCRRTAVLLVAAATAAAATTGSPAFAAAVPASAPVSAAAAVPVAAATARPAAAPAPAPAPAGPLTNLSHLDFLTTRVAPPPQARHTTWRLAAEPAVTVLWVYANGNPDGSFTRVGGGTYDPATKTYGQGAYDADDIARAAVVYLRHWRQSGDAASRDHARELLRGLTYLQTATGPGAGNVVLWMQPDGRLQPSATPADTPDPSDSGASYWLARTIWALGEGHADFSAPTATPADRAFARFLAAREDLAVRALGRETLNRYPRDVEVDGRARPAWLVTGGADASAEAVLGLSAYVDAGHGQPVDVVGQRRARTALAELSRGIASMSAGDAFTWPYGAVLPGVTSVSQWHAWAGLAPAALASASATLHAPTLLRAAQRDAVTFTAHLLVQGGPDDGWAPTPVDRSQIAYGADSRVESLQALADVTHQPAAERLTGVAASWFFGDNPAGRAVYDPRTGVTSDGVAADGTVNPGSGAESTIHGLLTMLALDRDPVAAAVARSAAVVGRTTDTLVEAESGSRRGSAVVVTPAQAATGESQWSGGAYVRLGAGGTVTLTAAVPAGALLMPVTRFLRGSAATRWSVGRGARTRVLGVVHQDRIGAPGVSPWPGALEVTTLQPSPPATTVTVTTAGAGTAAVDAVLVQPAVETLRLAAPAAPGAATLVRSFAFVPRVVTVRVAGHGTVTLDVFTAGGRLLSSTRHRVGAVLPVRLPAGGTALATRG